MSFYSRVERLSLVGSTNDVVAGWLADGLPEVAVATADVQTEGRGRDGRRWLAPPGAGLLLSAGFRPAGLRAVEGWRLAAVVALAMAEAAESVAHLPAGSVGLKWPNDLVADAADGSVRKLGGVLGESASEAGRITSAVVGIGLDVNWRRAEFPPELADTMTSLAELAGGAVDREMLLQRFLGGLEETYGALQRGRFDTAGWTSRQQTTGRELRLATGSGTIEGRGAGLDPESGSLIVETAAGLVHVASGEVVWCRIRPAGAEDRGGAAAVRV